MKRYCALVLIISLVLWLVACSSQGSREESVFSATRVYTSFQENLKQYGRSVIDNNSLQITLPENFTYWPGVGLCYQGIPGVVSFARLTMTEVTDMELCHYLTRGVCLQTSEPIAGLETVATYGLFSESYFGMADFGEVFCLAGTEEDFEELVGQTEELVHVVLFTVPEVDVQYMLKVNANLVSKEECLELAAAVIFAEDAFMEEMAVGAELASEAEETEAAVEANELLTGRKNWALTAGRAFLKVTLPGQTENLVPKGFFAVQESKDEYSLCIHNGWPVGRLVIGDEEAEISY